MLKHIVMFKMKAEEDAQQKAHELKEKLDALPGLIEEIKAFEIGLNFSDSPSAYDAVLISAFDNEEALNRYRQHPGHVKVLEFIKEVVASTAVVDYRD